MTSLSAPADASGAKPSYSPVYAWYVVVLLTIVYATNIGDRFVLGAVVESIKHDFQLSDTQVGLLTGLSFAILYSTLGLPIAFIADRWNRRNVISIAITVYATAAMICGFAANFIQLLLARIGVAVGEAGTTPPGHSIISDYFPYDKRTLPLSVFAFGASVGTWIGFSLGGYLGEAYGWRIAIVSLAIPGLLIALLVRTTVREPKRTAHASAAAQESWSSYTILSALKFIWKQKALRHVIIGASVFHLYGYAMNFWQVPYLMRSLGMGEREAGSVIGFWFAIVGGNVGIVIVGYATQWLGKYDIRWHAWTTVVLFLVCYIPVVASYLLPQGFLFILSYIALGILVNGMIGPLFTMTQNLVPVSMRAFAAAFMLFALNFVGFSFGPLLVGAASDFLQAHTSLGENSLRWAMIGDTVMILWSAFHFWLAARTMKQDYAAVGNA